jgi:hypothetical protein
MKYFSYGMNTNVEQMVSRCKDAVVISPAWVDGYELTFRTHADIESNPDARCHGVLWDITMRDLRNPRSSRRLSLLLYKIFQFE